MVLQGLGTAVCAPVPDSFDHSGPAYSHVSNPLSDYVEPSNAGNWTMCLCAWVKLEPQGKINASRSNSSHSCFFGMSVHGCFSLKHSLVPGPPHQGTPRPHGHYTLSDLPFPHPRAKLPQYPQHVHMLMTIANQHVHATHMPTARHSLSFQLKRTS